MTLAVPRLEDAAELRVKSAVRRVAGTLQYVFDQSVFKKIPYQVHYDLDKGEMWVDRPALVPGLAGQGAATQAVELQEVTSDSSLERIKLPGGVKFTDVTTAAGGKKVDGETQTQFLPQGFAEYTLVHLQDQAGHQWTVELNPLTGKAKVRDGYYEPAQNP